MDCPEPWDKYKESSVFELLTRLCEKTVAAYEVTEDFGTFNRTLLKKLRSHSFSILLKKSNKITQPEPCEPVLDMLSDYFVKNCNKKNLGDYNNLVSIKNKIDWLIERNKSQDEPFFTEALSCVVSLRNSVPIDHGKSIFENPFSFGKIDEILPSAERVNSEDPKPYQYFPPHIFHLPFSIDERDYFKNGSEHLYNFPMESFDAKPGTNLSYLGKLSITNVHSVSSRSSRGNDWSTLSSHSNDFLSCPRLTGPRELIIPNIEPSQKKTKPTLIPSNESMLTIKCWEEDECKSNNETLTDSTSLWNMVHIKTEVDLNLWDEAAKMSIEEKRPLICSSIMQMTNWKVTHMNQLRKLNIVSENLFILHIKYLTMGIESSSFIYNKSLGTFQMKEGLCLEGLLQKTLETYVTDLIVIGSCYWKLNHLVTPKTTGNDIIKEGFVYKTMCENIRQYLVWFRLQMDKIFGEGLSIQMAGNNNFPSLIQIVRLLKPFSWQIQTLAKIFRVNQQDVDSNLLRGVGLMAYLYNEITLVSQPHVTALLYSTLKSTCSVYFRFIQRFIFEGELEDHFHEFFIRKDFMNADAFNKRYWDKAFVIQDKDFVPEFLKDMAKHILLCGKSLRLLKLCNPDDPLCVLLSTAYPPIKCCLTFPEIEDQQRLYETYRIQCLYVCGEPVTFQTILLQREAEKKAFIEMVSHKQAETIDKLIDERKRLSQILSVTKRQQFSALRSAAEDAVARKQKMKRMDLEQDLLIREQQEASNRVHQLKVKEEKDKVNAYYTEIGKEVERRKMRAEWKMKRLRLDERRVQLLTSEKMNLFREKLELEHKVLDEGDMEEVKSCDALTEASPSSDTMSDVFLTPNNSETGFEGSKTNIQDIEPSLDFPQNIPETKSAVDNIVQQKIIEILSSNDEIYPALDIDSNENLSLAEDVNKNCNDQFSKDDLAIQLSDVVNKNTLLCLKPHKSLDIVLSPSDFLNSNVSPSIKSVSFSDQNIFEKYQQQKEEALRNKQKVMAHEFAAVERSTSDDIKDHLNLSSTSTPSDNLSSVQRNRQKILGSVMFDDNDNKSEVNREEMPQYNTDASREALKNKKKILGLEFNIGLTETEKNLGMNLSRESRMKQRGSLTLDLKGCLRPKSKKPKEESQSNRMSIDSTPDNFLMTPSEFPTRLDIETPSTLDIGMFDGQSASILTPSSQIESSNTTGPFTSDGFRFPNIMEQQSDEEENVSEYSTIKEQYSQTPDSEETFDQIDGKSKVWNFIDDEFNFDNFQPFGIHRTENESFTNMNVFNRPLSMESPNSPYTNFEDILAKVQKKPMTNIFKLFCWTEEEEDSNDMHNIENVDPSMMAACLQRSIMIPLSYQMEMVNNAILKYFLVNCELYDHLKSLCDYFFLMDGEFAKTICSKLFEKLNSTETPRELLNFATLHSILDKSFGSSIGGSNKYAENLSFIVTEMPLSFYHSSPDVLESLTLSYSVAWPLNIILSHEALNRYAKVFQFLIKMRRISWVLEQDLEILKMSLKEEFMVSQELLRSPQYHSIQVYRYTMSSFIRSLHGYVVNTCIKSSWTEFEKDLTQVATLDDLYAVHVAYIKKVLFRCLLNRRSLPIMKLLNEIFTVVLRFHHYLCAGCWHIAEDDINYTHPFFTNMKEYYIKFDKLSKHLHKTAHRLSECGYQPHLIELVTLLNMNGYYS